MLAQLSVRGNNLKMRKSLVNSALRLAISSKVYNPTWLPGIFLNSLYNINHHKIIVATQQLRKLSLENVGITLGSIYI